MPADLALTKMPVAKIGVQLFIRLAGALWLALALASLFQAAAHGPPLRVLDPLLGIPLRYATMTVGGLELVVALFCLFGRQTGIQLGGLVWLATNFAVYRLGLLWQGSHTQWGCLGNPVADLRLFSGAADYSLYVILGGLLLGSYAAALWLWFEGSAALPRRLVSNNFKMACPACGVHIKFSKNNLGQKIPCPQCRATITLRQPDLLKMTCFFCHEHIEFPPHAIGTKMACPHCKMDITLKEPA